MIGSAKARPLFLRDGNVNIERTEWTPPVPEPEMDWQEMGQRVLQQTFDLWISPEIERRRQRGVIDDSFTLRAAQVIFDPDVGAPVVRLNEEVMAVLHGRAKRGPIQQGEPLTEDDVDLQMVLLTSMDPNAGHITILRHKISWVISFDFRRNASRIAGIIAAAREFLESAPRALEDGHLRAFCVLLFAAVELTAKGELIMLPDRSLLESRTHEYLSSRYNQWGKLGNTDPANVSLLNRLAELLPTARYLQGEFALSQAGAHRMLETARAGLRRLEVSAPTRYPMENIQQVLGNGTGKA